MHMKFQLSKSSKENIPAKGGEEVDTMGFTKAELAEYDKHINFYYANIINSLILFTYNEEQLDKMAPILIDPLTELYEELDYSFTPILFETVLKNSLIDKKFRKELLEFKASIDKIPNEIWHWQFLDKHETWLKTRGQANALLNKIGITSRVYNDEFTTVHWIK